MNLLESNTNINYNIAPPETPSFKTQINYNHNTQSHKEIPPISMDETFCNDYIKPEIKNNALNNDINFDQNFITPTHNGNTRLKDVDNRILEFSDFHSTSYFMFFWSILCFLLSIWDITHLSNYKQIKLLYNIKKEIENNKWFYILNFVVNFYHCGVYFYGIRTYNLQSRIEMKISNKMLLSLTIINFIYFFIYLFFVPISFFTFFVDLIYFIFNIFLFFQSSELTLLYEEKYNIKLIYK